MIHGTADPLVAPSGGRATARAIPGAELMMVKGMGHDLPRAAWPQLIDGIAAHALQADAEAEANAKSEDEGEDEDGNAHDAGDDANGRLSLPAHPPVVGR